MTSDERLAAFFSELTRLGLPCLVMGGHAVRHYGIDRNTVDYDFHVALDPASCEHSSDTRSKPARSGR